MINLFTYGSLMCTDIMKLVCAQSCKNSKGLLNDFFRSQIQGESFPAIRPQVGGCVEGVIYFDLNPEAVARLDAFEGVFYERQPVVAIAETGEKIAAMTYVIAPEYQYLLNNQPWSFEEFLENGKKFFLDQYFGFNELPTP